MFSARFSSPLPRHGRRGFTILEVVFATAALGLALGATAKLMVSASTRMAISRVEEAATRLERALAEQYQYCAYGLLPTRDYRLTGVLYQPWDQASGAFRALAPYAYTVTRSTTGAGADEVSTIQITIGYQLTINVGETPAEGASTGTRWKERRVEVVRRPGPQL